MVYHIFVTNMIVYIFSFSVLNWCRALNLVILLCFCKKFSWEQVAGTFSYAFSQLFIIWFYGDIIWWKFRRNWYCSGIICVHRYLFGFVWSAVLDLELALVVQVPSAWKAALEDSSTLQIFFDYYALNQVFSKEVRLC